MDSGKSTPFSIRYNANVEELEELYNDDDPPTPQLDFSPSSFAEINSKKLEKPVSILGKYFKIKAVDKLPEEEQKSTAESSSKETTDSNKRSESSGSPMRDYLSRISKRTAYSESVTDPVKDAGIDTWKFFTGFKEKFSQAVEDLKSSRTAESNETNDKLINLEDSISDSEENDLEQISFASTDNQVSSIASSLQNFDDLPVNMSTQAAYRVDDQRDTDNTISEDSDKKTPIAEATLLKPCDDSVEIESGVEAIEEATMMEDKMDAGPTEPQFASIVHTHKQFDKLQTNTSSIFFTYKMMFLTFVVLICILMDQAMTMSNGFIIGVWSVSFINCVFKWIFLKLGLGQTNDPKMHFEAPTTIFSQITPVKEHRPDVDTYEGWINEYTHGPYNPLHYHISLTKTAYMKLEGKTLTIAYTKMKIAKRHLWNEKLTKVHFYKTKTFDLSGAKITLLPKGLVSKRQWSKKYPICIMLKRSNQIKIEKGDQDIILGNEQSQSPRKIITKDDVRPSVGSEDSLRDYESVEDLTSVNEDTENPPDISSKIEGLRKRKIVKAMIKNATNEMQSNEKQPVDMKLECENSIGCSSPTSTALPGSQPLEVSTATGSEIIDADELSTEDEETLLLYIFGRTGREKHEWYRRLYSTLNRRDKITIVSEEQTECEKSLGTNEVSVFYEPKELESNGEGTTDLKLKFTKGKERKQSTKSRSKEHNLIELHPLDFLNLEQEFWSYFKKTVQKQISKNKDDTENTDVSNKDVSWLNAILARCVFDTFRDKKMMENIEQKIQKKLNTIKLPSFMSPLVVSNVKAGQGCPLLRGAAPPYVDDRGVWIDLDFFYDGGFTFLITTQMNLMRFKKSHMASSDVPTAASASTENLSHIPESNVKLDSKYPKPAIYDSECEDTAESSSEDEGCPPPPPPPSPPYQQPEAKTNSVTDQTTAQAALTPNPSGAKKIIQMVDKIAGSKYFQQVVEYRYVKKAIEGVSNTDLQLNLEVKGLSGCLAVNLPPPPHDRFWFGFRANPQLWLRAKPIVGSRVISIIQITNWIEKRLCKEFEKVLVLPNMEDIVLPFLSPTPIENEF